MFQSDIAALLAVGLPLTTAMIVYPMIEMPPAIRAWLVASIERVWPEPAAVIAAIPSGLPAGQVQRLAGGGPFGLLYDGRLDEIDGRIALEVLENSRMSGSPTSGSGTTAPSSRSNRHRWISYSFGPNDTPEERAAAERAYFEHNRTAYALLRERGFN